MRYLIFILIISSLNLCFSQSHIDEVDEFQKDLNNEFLDPETSPLDESKIKSFKGHDFFEINQDYCIKAEFIKSIDIVTFQMKTSTSRMPTYDKFGIAKFNLNGKCFKNVKLALLSAKKNANKEDIIFISGSTFLVAEIL